jgi:hypothetical protein
VKLQQLCKLIDDVSGRAILFLSFEVVVMPNDHGQLMCQVILHNPAASKPIQPSVKLLVLIKIQAS